MKSIYLTLFVCFMAYGYNKKSVSLCLPKLIEEGLDTNYAGLIVSCHQIAFAGSKFVFGVLSDKINPLKLFTVGLFFSGLSSVLFSNSSSVFAFCAFWFMNGLAQGCGWPSISKILRQRADPTKFGTLWSFLSSSTNISACVASFLIPYLNLNYGWKLGLNASGLCSIVLCSLPLFVMNSASENSSNTKSVNEVSETKNESNKSGNALGKIKSLMSNSFIWLVFFCFLVVFCSRGTLDDWGQLYLKEERGLSFIHGSVLVSSLEIGGSVGRLLAGYLTDIFVKRSKGTQIPSYYVRMRVSLGFLLGSLISIHMFRISMHEDTTLTWIVCVGSLCGVFLTGIMSIAGIAVSESVPPHLSGSAYAIAALGGNAGSAIAGLPICFLAAQFTWYNVLILLEIFIGLALVLIFLFDHTKISSSDYKKND